MNQGWLLLLRLSLGARSDVVRLHLSFLGDLGVETQPRGTTLDDIGDGVISYQKSRCSLILRQHRLTVDD